MITFIKKFPGEEEVTLASGECMCVKYMKENCQRLELAGDR
jgi:hypothetical protein